MLSGTNELSVPETMDWTKKFSSSNICTNTLWSTGMRCSIRWLVPPKIRIVISLIRRQWPTISSKPLKLKISCYMHSNNFIDLMQVFWIITLYIRVKNTIIIKIRVLRFQTIFIRLN